MKVWFDREVKDKIPKKKKVFKCLPATVSWYNPMTLTSGDSVCLFMCLCVCTYLLITGQQRCIYFPPRCIFTHCFVSFSFLLSYVGCIVCVCLCVCVLVHVSSSSSFLCTRLPTYLPTCLSAWLGRGNHYAYYAYRHHEGNNNNHNTWSDLCVLQRLMGELWGSPDLTHPPKYSNIDLVSQVN